MLYEQIWRCADFRRRLVVVRTNLKLIISIFSINSKDFLNRDALDHIAILRKLTKVVRIDYNITIARVIAAKVFKLYSYWSTADLEVVDELTPESRISSCISWA